MNKLRLIAFILGIIGIISIGGALVISNNKTYNISFDTDGGSKIENQIVKKGNTVTKPLNPTKVGYFFIRWEYYNKEYDFKTPVESDFTLYAIWKKKDNNKNEENNTEEENEEIKNDETKEKNEQEKELKKYKITLNLEKISKTIEVSNINEINLEKLGFKNKDGYVLRWYLNNKEYTFTEPLTKDLIINGKYEKIVNTTKFKVKFNSDGGTSI